MEQVRPLTSLSQDELIARIEQYIVVVELRDAEIRELHAVNSALLAERDALREALQKVRPVIAADRQALIDTHGNGTEIPATDELGTLGLYEYDGALHAIDAALAQEQEEA